MLLKCGFDCVQGIKTSSKLNIQSDGVRFNLKIPLPSQDGNEPSHNTCCVQPEHPWRFLWSRSKYCKPACMHRDRQSTSFLQMNGVEYLQQSFWVVILSSHTPSTLLHTLLRNCPISSLKKYQNLSAYLVHHWKVFACRLEEYNIITLCKENLCKQE